MAKNVEDSLNYRPSPDDPSPETFSRIAPAVIKAPDSRVYEPEIGPKENADFWNATSLSQMVEVMKSNPKIEIDAMVLGATSKGVPARRRMGRKEFLEAVSAPARNTKTLHRAWNQRKLRENWGNDTDVNNNGDFIPLLGGPFNKQQYIRDYLKAHMESFYAFHHDPFARRIPSIIRDFTLARGWTVTAKADDPFVEDVAQAFWNATEKVNNIRSLMDVAGLELSLYGEEMIWELPGNQVNIVQVPELDDVIRRGLLPRFRLVDPSCIWDIITEPEDITNVLAYQWSVPTQYQMYTKDDKTGRQVPTLKFIFQQIEAAQLDHYKINCMSNEKRGRSDLYPILGYLKRLRDSINYAVIAQQKASAYCMDTTVDGSQTDINDYASAQEALGPIPPAGSEFIHTKKIERKYLGMEGGGAKDTTAFEWCLSAIAAGSGIPVHYFGVEMNSATSRASAMVSTEPVVKLFEKRQEIYSKMLDNMFMRTMKKFGINARCEVNFPEIAVQDRSKKILDIQTAQDNGWISKKHAATLVAKELGIKDYDFDKEQEEIAADGAAGFAPLSTPGAFQPEGNGEEDPEAENTGGLAQKGRMSQDMKKGLRDGRGA